MSAALILRLLLGGWGKLRTLAGDAAEWAWKNPALAALVLSLGCNIWLWIGWNRTDVKRVEIQHQFDVFVEQAKTAAAVSKAAQEAINAKQEQNWKEKADAADATIDDLRADLARSLRAGANRGSSGAARATAEDHSPGISQNVPAASAGDSQPVQVAVGYCWDAAKLADLSAYAIKAHEWATSLEEKK